MMLPFGCVHASTIIKYKKETLISFFAGPREGHRKTHIWLHNVTEGSLTQITHIDGPHWNPVLFEWKDSLYLAYKDGPHPWDWQTRIVLITDNYIEILFYHTIDGGPVKNKPIVMSNGQLIAGHSTEHDGWKCYASLLEPKVRGYPEGYHLDTRETWTNIPIDSSTIPGRGVIQPTLWESEPGHIHMMMRSAMGKVCRADSEDYGRTWGMARLIDVPNNNSGIDVVRIDQIVPHPDDPTWPKLEGFRLYLVLNPVTGVNILAHTRSPLELWYSDDNGEEWALYASLESPPGEFSYPAIVYDPKDNELLITYTYNKHSIKLTTISLEA